MTYRYHGHHVGDINREYYRSKDEEKDWKENRDPIVRFRSYLVEQGIATEDEIEAINAAVEKDATDAVAYAEAAAYPRCVRSGHARIRRLRRTEHARDYPVAGRERGDCRGNAPPIRPCS